MTETKQIEVNDTVAYRRVGIATVTEIIERTERGAFVRLDFTKGPKKYRSGGSLADGSFYVANTERIG